VAFEYHLKRGRGSFVFELTLAVGLPLIHCEELVAVGAAGNGRVEMDTVALEAEHPPLEIAESVYVDGLVTVVGNSAPVPILFPPVNQV
jgi:hypothetical protein